MDFPLEIWNVPCEIYFIAEMKHAALTVGISCWPYLYGNNTFIFFKLKTIFKFYIGVYLIYNVVLVVSGVQQSDFSYTYAYIYSFSGSFPI